MKKRLLHISIFVFAIFVILLSACENDIAVVKSISHENDPPRSSTKGIEIVYSIRGETKAVLTSPHLLTYDRDEKKMIMPQGITIFFYDSIQKVSSFMKADYAINYQDKNIIEAENNVVVLNKKGEKLNTEHLIWDQKNQKIYTNKFVKITTKEQITIGDGLESDEQFENWDVINPKVNFLVDQDFIDSNDSTSTEEE